MSINTFGKDRHRCSERNNNNNNIVIMAASKSVSQTHLTNWAPRKEIDEDDKMLTDSSNILLDHRGAYTSKG